MAVTAAPRDAMPPTHPDGDPAGTSFEVVTVSADSSRANIRTFGALTRPTCAVLVTVLHAHLHAGRRELHVDLGGSAVLDDPGLAALTAAYRRIAEGAGMLAFENAPPRLVDAIRAWTPSFTRTVDNRN